MRYTPMTDKQKTFCEEYLVDLNAKQAAIRAGYSARTAEAQASRELAKVKNTEYISKKMAERSKRTGISADRVVRELARIAFVNVSDVISAVDGNFVEGATEDDMATVASVRVKMIPTREGMAIEREIKFADKVKALELLGKHLAMFTEKKVIEIGDKTMELINVYNLPLSEKQKLLAEFADETTDESE